MSDKEPIYLDLLISNDDLQTNNALAVEHATDRVVIAQDIVHAIRESGLALPLVGMRDRIVISKILTDIELLVEQDKRLLPGSIKLYYHGKGKMSLSAKTNDFNLEQDAR